MTARLINWSGHDGEGNTVSGELPVEITQPVYRITLADDGTDQTVSLQQQINAVPDGTPGAPSIIELPAGRWWTEGNLANNPRGANGILRLHNRHHLILQGPAEAAPTQTSSTSGNSWVGGQAWDGAEVWADVEAEEPPPAPTGCTLYTKAPAVPYSATVGTNTHSLRRHVWIVDSSDITVRHLRIEGSNYTEGRQLSAGNPWFWEGGADTGALLGYPGYRAGWETEHAFAIHDSTNITIEDFAVDAVWGDGVYVGNHTFSQNIIVRRGHIRFAGRQGIAAAAVDGWLIEDVWIEKGRRAGIDLEPHADRLFCRNVEVRGCTIDPMQTVHAALGQGDVSDIWIHDNTEISPGSSIICGDSMRRTRRARWLYENNIRTQTFGSPQPIVRFHMTDDITLRGNQLPVSSVQSRLAAGFEDCGGQITITGNNFSPGGDKYYNRTPPAGQIVTVSGNTPALQEVP